MLGNQVELWETMLAAMKLGAVVIPATTLLAESDLRDRIERGDVRHVVVARPTRRSSTACPGRYSRIAVGGAGRRLARLLAAPYAAPAAFAPDGPTRGRPTRCCCTSRPGTTARPKLVEHTHASLSGRAPVDAVLDRPAARRRPPEHLSSPGWAKHAWSSFFAPWLAEATVAIFNYARFDAGALLRRDRRPRRDDALRAADRVADADPGGPGVGARRRCARSSAPASR